MMDGASQPRDGGDGRSRGQGYGVVLALLAAALFGASVPASKVLLGGAAPVWEATLGRFGPFQLAGLLYLGAAIGVLPTWGFRPSHCRRVPINSRTVRLLGGAVVFGGLVGPVLLMIAMTMAPAKSVSLLLNLELVATAVLGVVLFREPLGRAGWLGVGAALLAGVVLTGEGGRPGVWAGMLVAGACLCWGLDNHLTALIDGLRPSQSTFFKGLFAGSVNLGIGLAVEPWRGVTAGLAAALLVGALSYGASITLYIAAAQQIGATRGQVVFAAAPFIGALLALAVLGEGWSWPLLVAAPLLVLAIALLMLSRHTHRHVHEAIEHVHSHRHDDGHHFHQHPGLDPSTRHTHRHRHERLVHAHPHWPDIHHRHEHEP